MQKAKIKMQNFKAFSLVEILVVIAIFGILGVLTTRSIFLTVRGSKKSDSLVRVRENVNYSLSIIERQIRNAQTIDCMTSTSANLVYTSFEGVTTNFMCSGNYIASGSARLTSSDITVTGCAFTCTQTDSSTPPSVKVSITAEDAQSQSIEKGRVTSETEIVARNY